MVDARKVSRVLGEMLTMGANVNMYVSIKEFSLCADLVNISEGKKRELPALK